jgi:hypothetical protein
MPGKTNWIADGMSRYPNSSIAGIHVDDTDEDPELEIAAVIQENAAKLMSVTWERVRDESQADSWMKKLIKLVQEGFPNERSEIDPEHSEYWRHRESLYVQDGVLMYNDRVVVPHSLRKETLIALHSANQGVSSMLNLAQKTVFWPGLTADVEQLRKSCRICNRIAPSQAKLPPVEPEIPKSPFECCFSDYADLGKSHYLIMGDRLSGWLEIVKINVGSTNSGAKGLIASLREWIGRFGAMRELSSDGGPEYTAAATTQQFLEKWGIKHRRSAAYNPQSNGRAEVAVKAAKRALIDNVDTDGTLNTDKMVKALLALRNTPHPGCKLSPAEIIFNRKLRGLLPISPFRNSSKFECPEVDSTWKEAWEMKENALRERQAVKSVEKLGEHCRPLKKLTPGDKTRLEEIKPNGRSRARLWKRKEMIATMSRLMGVGASLLETGDFFGNSIPWTFLQPLPPAQSH